MSSHSFKIGQTLWQWLCHVEPEKSLLCIPAKPSWPQLKIWPCNGNITHLLDLANLKNMDELEHGKCFVPLNPSFPTLDTVLITNRYIFTLQMTISSHHDAKTISFKRIHNNLPHNIQSCQWCHVFITNMEKKAMSLREKVLPEIH